MFYVTACEISFESRELLYLIACKTGGWTITGQALPCPDRIGCATVCDYPEILLPPESKDQSQRGGA
jgi:hypothetical protein